ncbi:MAG TPA: hypothetical protein VIJ57_09725, partial [Hanamia sp.]
YYITITKTTKYLCDTTLVPAGYTVKQEYTLDNSDATITATKTEVVGKGGKTYRSYKTVETTFKNFGGWGILNSDEKDKSILHINYWLNHPNLLRKVLITLGTRKIGSDGKLTAWKDTSYFVVKDTTVYLQKLYDASYQLAVKEKWFDAVNTQIVVYADSSKKKIAYYLIDKYDRNADYSIKLQNRESISFPYYSWDFGPVTIPIKQRFGYTKGNITIDPQLQTDLNVGVFGGFTMGRYRKRYEAGEPGELKDLSNLSFTFGGFLNISTAALDSTATTTGKLPFAKDKTATIGVVSFGAGVLTTFYNFQIGLFAGMDKGVGTNAQNWNYNNKPWVGIGIGYDLKKLFFK